ncbi:MAG: hypothetical protein MRY64_06335 [Hyphomonadaceae bacterium]|nr:hypothetical protein [Hyphomonadaceae bacterium]
MRRFLLSLLIAGAVVGLAHGEETMAPRQAAADAYAAGRYADAARIAVAADTADAYALAARAVLAEAMCQGAQPSDAVLTRAELLAAEALTRDPNHVEGRLQLAIALSLRMRPMSKMQAWRTGLGEEARELAEGVIRDDPANAYAHGFLAVWHVEVVRRGGSFGAAMMGASLEQAFNHYERARALAPNDAGLHWQMARALAAYDPEDYRGEIDAALARTLAADEHTALQRVMVARAWLLKDALQSEDSETVAALAASLL